MAYNDYKEKQSWAGTTKRALSSDESSDEPILADSSRSDSDGGGSGSGTGSGSQSGSGSETNSNQTTGSAVTHVTNNVISDSQLTINDPPGRCSQDTSQEPANERTSDEGSLKSLSPQHGTTLKKAETAAGNETTVDTEAASGTSGDGEATKDKIVRTRRKNSELKKSFVCEYDRCGRAYASHHARWLHYRIKHKQGDVFTEMKKKANPQGTQQNLVPIQSSGSMSMMPVLVMGAMHPNGEMVQQNQSMSVVQTSQGPMGIQGTVPMQSQSIMVQTHQTSETMMINTQQTVNGQPQQVMSQPLQIAQPVCVRRGPDGQLMIALQSTQQLQQQQQQQQQQVSQPQSRQSLYQSQHQQRHSQQHRQLPQQQQHEMEMSGANVGAHAHNHQTLSSGPQRRFTTAGESSQETSGGASGGHSSRQTFSAAQHTGPNRKAGLSVGHKHQSSHHRHHHKQHGHAQNGKQVQARGRNSGNGYKPSRKRNRSNTTGTTAEAAAYTLGHNEKGISSDSSGLRYSAPQDYPVIQSFAQQQSADQQHLAQLQKMGGTPLHQNAHQWSGSQQPHNHAQEWKRMHHQMTASMQDTRGTGRDNFNFANMHVQHNNRPNAIAQVQGSCSSSDGSSDSGQKAQCTCSNHNPVRQGHLQQSNASPATNMPARREQQIASGRNGQGQLFNTQLLKNGQMNQQMAKFNPFHDSHAASNGQDHVQVQHSGFNANHMDFVGLNYNNDQVGADSAYASERSNSYHRNGVHEKHIGTTNAVYASHHNGDRKNSHYPGSFDSSSKVTSSYNTSSGEGSSEESGPGANCNSRVPAVMNWNNAGRVGSNGLQRNNAEAGMSSGGIGHYRPNGNNNHSFSSAYINNQRNM